MTGIQFVNLTTRTITIWTSGSNKKEFVFSPSGQVAKIRFSEHLISGFDSGPQLKEVEATAIEGLPEEVRPDLRYIVMESVFREVSRFTRYRLHDRKDLVFACGPVWAKGKDKKPLGPYRFFMSHPRKEVDRFYAKHGFFSDGIPMEEPEYCVSCRKWKPGKGFVLRKQGDQVLMICGDCKVG